MPEKCTDNPRDCPLFPRVEALEEANKQHAKTHQRIFDRLDDINRETGEQDATLSAIDKKMDRILDWQEKQHDRLARIDGIPELSKRVADLESKPGKRWEGIVDKVIWAIAGAVIVFLLGRVGL